MKEYKIDYKKLANLCVYIRKHYSQCTQKLVLLSEN